MNETKQRLDLVFGEQSRGDSPEERAANSQAIFVRSQHQLSQYRKGATGRLLNASEALRLVGWKTLDGIADFPAVPIIARAEEPYRSILRQLSYLGVSLNDIARKIGWPKDVTSSFNERKQIPFRRLERLARILGIDEDTLGITGSMEVDLETGVRLRTFRNSDSKLFSPNTVLALAETAWTVQKQYRLAKLLGLSDDNVVESKGFTPSTNYGSPLTKTYMEGYRLAEKTRELLGLSADEPIRSMKDLIEKKLSIPVIQLEIHSQLAGATISSGRLRGIAINLKGDNANPLSRRMTMAHELGHLLWDPDQRLKRLVVDKYESIERDAAAAGSRLDVVERRANAFAIEFLAPRDASLNLFEGVGGGAAGLEKVISTYGVGRTAISHHLTNVSHNKLDIGGLKIQPLLSDEWEAAESLAVPVFDPLNVPISRRGRFARYVLDAYEAKLISQDTAASLYQCSLEELDRALASTRNFIT